MEKDHTITYIIIVFIILIIYYLIKLGLKKLFLSQDNGDRKWLDFTNKIKSKRNIIFVFIAGFISGIFKIIFNSNKKK